MFLHSMEAFGRYQLHEQLGHGGMGVVYRAHDTVLERVVALKLVAGPYANDPEMRERFFREARAAGHLTHKNIVTIYDLGEHEGRPYIAMEYLAGEDLQRRLARPEKMPLSRRIEIAIEACQGVEHAHHHGIVHRDLKPANIFLTDSGGVKILDFGLARPAASQLTHSNMLMGTLNYMAPEQVRGERADERADIFSLGVVMYELFGGRKAFEGDSVASTLYKILEDVPEPLHNFEPELPPGLWAIVERALAKNRDDRYQHAGALLGDLYGIQQMVAPAANSSAALTPIPGSTSRHSWRPAGPPPASARVPDRRRAVAVAAAVMVFVAVSAVGWAMLHRRSAAAVPPDQAAQPRTATTAAAPPSTSGAPPPVTAAEPTKAVEPPKTNPAEQDAKTARGRMVEGRAAAEAAGAPMRAATQYRNALRRAQEADRLFAAKDFSGAASRFYEASGLFRNAEGVAHAAFSASQSARPSIPPSRTDAPRESTPARPAAEPVPAASAAASPKVAAPTPSAPAAPPDTSSPSAAVPPTPQPQAAPPEHAASQPEPPRAAAPVQERVTQGPSDEERLTALLGRYREALEARNLDQLKQIWPSLGGAAEAAIRQEFQHASRISVDIESPRISLTGATGRIGFVRQYRLTTVEGQQLQSTSLVTMNVRRSGPGWVIDGVRFSPR